MKKILLLLASAVLLNSCTSSAPQSNVTVIDSTFAAIDTTCIDSAFIATQTVVAVDTVK